MARPRTQLPPDLVTIAVAARRLGVTYKSVFTLVARGDLRAGRFGRARVWCVEAASVDAYLAARATAALAVLTTPEQE